MRSTFAFIAAALLFAAPVRASNDLPDEDSVNHLSKKLEKMVDNDAARKKDYVFDPADLAEIARKGAGLPIEQAFDLVQHELSSRYGDHISTARHWIFNDAGTALGQLTLMHCSTKEYVIFFGSPLAINGFSGRYPMAEFFDFMLAGEMRTFSEGDLQPQVYPPGTYAHLEKSQGKGYSTTPGSWMLEYGRGNIISAFPFGVTGPARYITHDWKAAKDQIVDCGKLAIHEIFGSDSRQAREWDRE
ncbi:MAG TPA: hypothetical protein VL588_12710 [Bdellovibrionota bacterium]|jgi:C-8 sterol isomerase|nr:hypothetical protein [Bdellovibrionota bacterium]